MYHECKHDYPRATPNITIPIINCKMPAMKLVCCVLFIYALSPYTAVADSSGSNNDKSSGLDISNVIGFLSNGNNMHAALKALKGLKIESGMFKTAVKLSPLLQQVLTQVGNKNAQARIVLDLLNGHVPSLKDMFDLLGKNNVYEAMNSVLDSNPQLHKLLSLFNKSDFASSKSDVEESLLLITGHHFDLQSAMIPDHQTGKFKLTSSTSNKYRNLVEMTLFIRDNLQKVLDILHEKEVDPAIFLKNTLDSTHLARLRDVVHTEGGKYSVSGSHTGGLDVEVGQVLTLMTLAKSKKTSGGFQTQEATVQMFSKVVDLFNKAIQQAMATDNVIG